MNLNNFESLLAGHLKKLVGVHAVGDKWFGWDPKEKPAGVQLFSGQEVSRASYPKHWELVNSGKRTLVTEAEWQAYVAEHGHCPWYSMGNGSTTYRFPLIKGVHPKFVAALAEAGQYIEAGLPAHSHKLYVYGENGSATGKLSNFMTSDDPSGNGYIDVKNYAGEIFDSPIYGRSDTVQPPSVTCVLGEYVVGSVATVGEANAESLLASVTQLEGEVGALGNRIVTPDAYIVETWRSGTEWYRKWSDGWTEQGGFCSSTSATTITLGAPFTTTDYTIIWSETSYNVNGSEKRAVQDKKTTSFVLEGGNLKQPAYWYACGY